MSDDAFGDVPFAEDKMIDDDEMHDDEEEDFSDDDAWNNGDAKPTVISRASSQDSSSAPLSEEDFEDDEMFEEMEELWEEVEDEDEADYHDDDEDDEMMDEDFDDDEENGQQQLQSSFRGLVDRPAQVARRNSSLDSLEEEDSHLGVSSVEPSKHGVIENLTSTSSVKEDESGHNWESFDDEDHSETVFAGGPLDTTDSRNGNALREPDEGLWGEEGEVLGQDPFETTDAWASIKDEAVGDNAVFSAANELPASHANVATEVSDDENDNDSPKVEKWLDRHADDPDDYEYACCRLIHIIYGEDEDHHPDTMMRRTESKDLYRYLKQQYWYLVHTGQLEENELCRVSMLTEDSEDASENGRSNVVVDFPTSDMKVNGNLDAVLNARKESQRSMMEEGSTNQGTDEASVTEEEEIRNELQRIKEEEARVLAEETKLRDALKQQKHQVDNDQNVPFGTAGAPENEKVASVVTPKGASSTSVTVTEEEIEDEDSERADNDSQSQSSFPRDSEELPMKREIEDDQFEIGKRSKANDDDEGIKNEVHASADVTDGRDYLQEERFENYTIEYNDLLDRRDNGEDIDEVRLYFLELAVRQRADDDLTESELLELSQFDDQEALNFTKDSSNVVRDIVFDSQSDESCSGTIQDRNAQSNDGSLVTSGESSKLTTENAEEGPDREESDNESEGGSDSGIRQSDEDNAETTPVAEERNVTLSSEALDEALNATSMSLELDSVNTHQETEVEGSEEGKRDDEPDPVELEWRKKKLVEDLNLLVERAEEEELEDLIPPEVIAALQLAASEVAFTRKYYDAYEKRYVYFPSVAKTIYEYALIDAAERYYEGDLDEFPFEYANALCTVAASQLKGNVDEVDEKDEDIQNIAVDVRLGDVVEGSVELEMRRAMIEDEISTLILDAEQQELGGKIDPDIVMALKKGALETAHIKKVFDTKKDKYVYFPSVAKAVYNFNLIEAAEKHLENGKEEISLEFTNPLCTIAASFLRGNVDEVDPDDVYVKSTAVYVDLGDGVDRNPREEDEASICLSLRGAENDHHDEASQESGSASFTGKQLGESFEDAANAFGNEAFGSSEFMSETFQQISGAFSTDSLFENTCEHEIVCKKSHSQSSLNSSLHKVSQAHKEDEEHNSQSSLNNSFGKVAQAQDEEEPDSQSSLNSNLKELSEQEYRIKMIQSQIELIICDVQENELDEGLGEEAISALRSIASSLALVKKYFDVTSDVYVYFPSVAKTIMDYSLFDEAERRGVIIPLEHVSALRATASKMVEKNDVNEADDYVINMAVDVNPGTLKDSSSHPEDDGVKEYDNADAAVDAKNPENMSEQQADAARSKNPELSESERLHELAKRHLHEILKQAEERELQEEFESEAVDALEAALHLCFKKKFYDVLNDNYVYFPTVAQSLVDYTLTEEAECHYFDKGDEFPTVYTASLRGIAIALAAEDCNDYDYMDIFALPVEASTRQNEDNTKTEEEVECVDQSPDNTSNIRTPPVITKTVSSDGDQDLSSEDCQSLPYVDCLPGDEEDKATDSFKAIGDHTEAESNVAGSYESDEPTSPEKTEVYKSDPDQEIARSSSEHNDALESHETGIIGKREVIVTVDNDKDLRSVPSELTQANVDDLEAEDVRLKEMAQILEFKRRVDKQKISDDANRLEEMKRRGQQKLQEEKKALEEEIRVAEARLNEEAALLHEKWLEDHRKIERDLEELKATSQAELRRVEGEIQSLEMRRQEEEQRIENNLREIAEERLADELIYSQKLQTLRTSIEETYDALEVERRNVEDEIREADLDDKGRNFFGFGGRAKKSDVEKEKFKQTKIMEFKLREMELENEIKDMEGEEGKLKAQSSERENHRLNQKRQLDDDARNIKKTLFDVGQGLKADQMKIEAKLQEGEAELRLKKSELDATRKDDESWLKVEKQKLYFRREEIRQHLDRASRLQKQAVQREEDRLNRNAIALKDKWVKDEAAFVSEVEALERSKTGLDLTQGIERISTQEKCRVNEAKSAMGTDKSGEAQEILKMEPDDDDDDNMSQNLACGVLSPPRKESAPTDDQDDVPTRKSESKNQCDRYLKVENGSTIMEPAQDASNQVPDHLVVLNQPKQEDSLRSRESIHSVELFDHSVESVSRKKPLLAAALKAKKCIEMNLSLSALDALSPAKEQEPVQHFHKSVPDHLVMLNQPSAFEALGESMRSLDVFDHEKDTEKPSKPLLAAALKAKSNQMASSFSALEGLPHVTPDTSDLSKSAPGHLSMIHQPKSLDASGELESIGELDDVFDPPPILDPDAIPNKPLLTAALKAKKEQLSKSFSIADGIFFDSEKEIVHHIFSKSVPALMTTDFLDMEFEQFKAKHAEMSKPLAEVHEDADVESSDNNDLERPDVPLREVKKDITPRRKKKQDVGLASKLMQEALAFKENSLHDGSSSSHNTKENDMMPSPSSEKLRTTHEKCAIQDPTQSKDEWANEVVIDDLHSKEVSSPERMSWWNANGRRLVDIHQDPAMEEEKQILTESLLSHNHAIANAKRQCTGSTPQKEEETSNQIPDSLSEKRRKAAEARQRAMNIRSMGLAVPDGEHQMESDGQSTREVSFEQARKSLLNRVETSKAPAIIVSPIGNARAIEWAEAAETDKLEDETFEAAVESIDDSGRLDWWRQNGKRLVEDAHREKKASAVSIEPQHDVKTTLPSDKNPSSTSDASELQSEPTLKEAEAQKNGMPRREILAEKRRQIVAARSSSGSREVDNGDSLVAIDKSTCLNDSQISRNPERPTASAPGMVEEKKKRLREMEAQRLAERTKKAREYRLMREAQLAEANEVTNNDAPVETPRASILSESTTSTDHAANPTKKNFTPSIILQPMVREADRLSGFIRRYENKLETVCMSLLTVASEDNESRETALAAKDLPLAEMLAFIHGQEWYKAHSAATATASGRPALMFSRPESKRAVMEEMSSERGIESSDNIYTLTAVGRAFVEMDGPVQADVGRFLAHLDHVPAGMTKATMIQNWNEIARLSGDLQSRRVCNKLDELISFCLDAHMIK